MTFYKFILSLPFPEFFSVFLLSLLSFLIAFGIYKFVKDWLPW